MSRSIRSRKASLPLVLALLACCTLQVAAMSLLANLTEIEGLMPFACPDDCGTWCDCKFPDRTGFINETSDEVTLPDDMMQPLPSGTVEEDDDDDDPPSNKLGVRNIDEYLEALNTTLILLKARQADSDIINSPGLTKAESWRGGKIDWWNKIKRHTKNQGYIFDYWAKSTAYVHHLDADEWGTPLTEPPAAAGGYPAVRGCTIFIAASDLGVAVAHFWEHPTFVATKRTEYGLERDPEAQQAAYETEVILFLHEGFEFYEAKPPNYPQAPPSPPITDLIKPGMILDPHTTLWRQFRLFHAYGMNGPPRQNVKNAGKMREFREDLAVALQIPVDDLKVHSPLYEPHDMGPEYRASEPWFNTLTWQYAPAHDVDGQKVRAFRASFSGDEIQDMVQYWKPSDLDLRSLCRIQVKAYAYETLQAGHNHLLLSIKMFNPRGTEMYNADNEMYELGRVPADQLVIRADKTGLDTNIHIWFSEVENDQWTTHPLRRPSYDNWHIGGDFGKGQMYVYSGDRTARQRNGAPMCRGGSWTKSGVREAVWHRTSSCQFVCSKP